MRTTAHAIEKGRPVRGHRSRWRPACRGLAVALAGTLLLQHGVALAATVAPVPTPPPTGSLRVTVTLLDQTGTPHPASDAVVWLPRAAASTSAGVRQAEPKIAQRQKTFEPHVEVARVGSSVAFPNYDRIFHNVFSLSEIAPFDLGLYRNGASRSLAFTRPGVVRIYCNIHPSMAAFLVVVDSDFSAKTPATGIAELREIPAGEWTVKVWHERSGEQERKVRVRPGELTAATVQLDASSWRVEPHKNKFGKDYPPPDDDENRY